ncbi:MAG: alpha-glucosidase [Thermodesulfobacteriota bacterium]
MIDDRVWWKHGVLYQVYPRSFYDSDGDGQGDLPGLIQKLDYLSDLGVSGLWLSPIYGSPMLDGGYDVSDYRAINPIFGTEEDFQRLLKQAHDRGLRIIMDLVLAHTSHLHPWFIESRSSMDNPKRDWYIWHDGRNGRRPNNWRSAFGGPGWTWDEKTRRFYHHQFLAEQPQVNWRNPGLKQAMFDLVRYWLDRGVDGFRLDVCNYYLKDELFRNNPFKLGPTPRPYDLQAHIYDGNRPETHQVLQEFRQILDEYREKAAVGEAWFEAPGDPTGAAAYYGRGGDELHLVFDFSLLHLKKWDAVRFYQRIKAWLEALPAGAWPCWVLDNHDAPRSISRFGGGSAGMNRAKVLAVLLLTLKGTPFIYYGAEIGLKNGRLGRRDIQDPAGRRYWPFHKGRDPARTPMPWTAGPQAGFTIGRPWLPVNPDYPEVNVARQLQEPASLLNLYRSLLTWRNKEKALHRGEMAFWLDGRDQVLAFHRTWDREKVLVALNFAADSRRIAVASPGPWRTLLSTHRPAGEELSGPELVLAPHEAGLFKTETDAG